MSEPLSPRTPLSLLRTFPGFWSLSLILGAAIIPIFLCLPLLSLFVQVPFTELAKRISSPVVLNALRLSLLTSFSSAVIIVVFGLPTAYFFATSEFPGKRALEVLMNLPMVLPPTVAGLGLLLAFGRSGLVGGWLARMGWSIPFSTVAVVLAQLFVATPFFVNAARSGFEAVDPHLLKAASSLGASPFYCFLRIVLPLSSRSLAVGMAMAWARSLGEFGATITFAGNLPGVTQTMPLAVYMAMQSDLQAAVALSVLLLIVSFGILMALRTRVFLGPR
ncbi:MAG: ABC transporter permease [Acidobacteriia bacterium]|nr:ABC transporter permease [Terriglobia bacterium]